MVQKTKRKIRRRLGIVMRRLDRLWNAYVKRKKKEKKGAIPIDFKVIGEPQALVPQGMDARRGIPSEVRFFNNKRDVGFYLPRELVVIVGKTSPHCHKYPSHFVVTPLDNVDDGGPLLKKGDRRRLIPEEFVWLTQGPEIRLKRR